MIEDFTRLFDRDLDRLRSEIDQYQNEASLWLGDERITNSAGNLCLHLIGNLNHFIGYIIGNTGYKRDREAEFNTKDVPKSELIEMIASTKMVVSNALDDLDGEDLEHDYPIRVFGEDMSYGYFLIHLANHLNYHLGQINYHRRLLDK